MPVESPIDRDRTAVRRNEIGHRLGGPVSQENRDSASAQGDQQPFQNHLPHELNPGGAQRLPDRNLPPPGDESNQHQRGDVGAGQQKHHAGYGQKNRQRRREINIGAERRAPQRVEIDSVHARMVARILRHQLLHQYFQLLRGACAADAGAKPSHRIEPGAAALFNLPNGGALADRDQRQPCIGSNAGLAADEPLRRHADDCERPLVDRDRLSHDGRVRCESRLPKGITQHQIGCAACICFFLRPEKAAQEGLDSQHVKIIRRRVGRVDALRRVPSG